jgi:HJR/Mrr/RecB family endonuclease
MTTPTDQHVARLNLAIADQTSEISRLSHEYRTALTAKSLLDVKLAYYSLASHIRKPWHAIAAWPLFVFAIGPCIVAALILIATNEATNSWQTATLWSGLSAAVSVLIFAVLLYVPSRSVLPSLLDEFCNRRKVLLSRSNAVGDQLSALKRRVEEMIRQREQLLRSEFRRREELLLRNWRAMRDSEWEEYLADVFQALGAQVQRTGRSGDQGVDLIVEIGTKRIAVQAKGYYNSVSGSAVQEAVAGVAHYRCNASAVITNSRFTKGAIELAASNRCLLIGEAEIPDFVLGNLAL